MPSSFASFAALCFKLVFKVHIFGSYRRDKNSNRTGYQVRKWCFDRSRAGMFIHESPNILLRSYGDCRQVCSSARYSQQCMLRFGSIQQFSCYRRRTWSAADDAKPEVKLFSCVHGQDYTPSSSNYSSSANWVLLQSATTAATTTTTSTTRTTAATI